MSERDRYIFNVLHKREREREKDLDVKKYLIHVCIHIWRSLNLRVSVFFFRKNFRHFQNEIMAECVVNTACVRIPIQ